MMRRVDPVQAAIARSLRAPIATTTAVPPSSAQSTALVEQLRRAEAQSMPRMPRGQMIGRYWAPPNPLEVIGTTLGGLGQQRKARRLESQIDVLGQQEEAAARAEAERAANAAALKAAQEAAELGIKQEQLGINRAAEERAAAREERIAEQARTDIGKLAEEYAAGRITREEYDIGVDAIKRRGLTINVGADKAMTPDQLLKYVDAEGNHPPPGTTMNDLAGMDGQYTLSSLAAQKEQRKLKSGAASLGSLASYGFDESGVSRLFPPDDANLIARSASGAQALWRSVTQDPEHPELILYNRNKAALATRLAKSFGGESGMLSNQDIARFMQLYPIAGFTSGGTARAQFSQMAQEMAAAGVPKEFLDEVGLGWFIDNPYMPGQPPPQPTVTPQKAPEDMTPEELDEEIRQLRAAERGQV